MECTPISERDMKTNKNINAMSIYELIGITFWNSIQIKKVKSRLLLFVERQSNTMCTSLNSLK